MQRSSFPGTLLGLGTTPSIRALYLRVLLYNSFTYSPNVFPKRFLLGVRGNRATSLGNIRRKMPHHLRLRPYAIFPKIQDHVLAPLSVDDGVTCFCCLDVWPAKDDSRVITPPPQSKHKMVTVYGLVCG